MLRRASARNVVLNFSFLINPPFFDIFFYEKLHRFLLILFILSNISFVSEILGKLFIL